MSAKLVKTSATVTEIEPGGVRLRVGMRGHQHRILFPMPAEHMDPFRRALASGAEVAVWIEVPADPDETVANLSGGEA